MPAKAKKKKKIVVVVGGGGGWLLNVPANMLVYPSDRSAQTIVCAATLR